MSFYFAMEKEFRKIGYFKKSNLNLSKFGEIKRDARSIIDSAKPDDCLVLRLKINSPVVIEAAELLTEEGIRRIAKIC